MALEDRRVSATPGPPAVGTDPRPGLDVQLLTPWTDGDSGDPWIRPLLGWFSRCFYLDVGHGCNQRCRYCFQDKAGARFYDSSRLETQVALARRLGLSRAILIGGEPLLAPSFDAVLGALRTAGAAWGLMTNGTALADRERVNDLVGRGLGFCQVSFDSPRPEVQDSLARNPGLSARLRLALDHLGAHPGVVLVLNCVVTRENVDHLQELVAFVAEWRDRSGARPVLTFTQMKPSAVADASLLIAASEVARAVSSALVAAERCGLPAGFRNIPLCLMRGLERRASEWWVGLYAMDPDGCVSEVGEGGVDGVVDCAPCGWRDRCAGLSAPYAARFGGREVRPVPPAPLRGRSPLAGEWAVDVAAISDGRPAYFSPSGLRSRMERRPPCTRLVLGGPEPLLHPHLPAVIADAARLAPEVWIETDGALLSRPRLAEILRRYGLAGVRLVDGSSGGHGGQAAGRSPLRATLERCGLAVEPVLDALPQGPAAVPADAGALLRTGARRDGRMGARPAARTDAAIDGPSLSDGPTATLLLSTRCNFRCDFCYIADHEMGLPREAALDGATRLLATGCRQFLLAGGEPTQYPHLPELAGMLASAGARAVLVTNGLRLADRDLVRTLCAAGIAEVVLSFHHHTSAEFARLAGVADPLPRVLAAFDNMVAEGLSVIVHHVLYARNADRFPEFVRFYARRLRVPGRVSLSVSNVLLLNPALHAAPSVVPRLEAVRGPFAAGLAAAEELGIRLSHGGSADAFPECVFGPGGDGAGRPRERWIQQPRAGRLGFILAGARESFPGLEPDGLEDYNALFHHLPGCAACIRRGSCLGVQRAYAALHGTDEFQPIR